MAAVAEQQGLGVLRPVPGRLWRELLLGPAYWWHKRLIRVSRKWGRPAQRAYQQKKASWRFRRYGEEVRDKEHYRQRQSQYNVCCFPGLTKLMRTGGTTASPFTFYMDTLFRRQKERAYLFDAWSRAGFSPFDLRVVYRGNVGDRLISYNLLEHCYVISPSLLSRANAPAVAAFLRGLPPFFLHVYPSSLVAFIELIGEEQARSLPVRGVLAGSESFPPRQMEEISTRFGWSIAHWYGHAEYAAFAYHCRDCGGFHFYPTYGLTELMNGPEDAASIVATSFNLLGTRFVRYDTGDVARSSSRTCEDSFPRVDSILGREQEFFVDRQGARRAFGPFLFGIHDEFWERVRAIQFVQRRAGELIVRIVLAQRGDRARVEAYLDRRFGDCTLRFEYPGSIERTRGGKHRYFVNEMERHEH